MFGFISKYRAIRMEIKSLKLEKAQNQLTLSRYFMLPHQLWPVTVVREGGSWLCGYMCDPNPMNCVIAYGATPQQACINFDALWNADPDTIIDPEEEEEQF